MADKKLILELENITKIFPGVKALDNVKLEIYEGEVHALCGENGAGKSTLMKIISGAQEYTSGNMRYQGENVKFSSTKEAQELGISMIYQEFNLIPHLTVAENIFLGRYPVSRKGIIDWKKMNQDAKELIAKVGLNISPKKLVKNLSVAEAQMIEISKCLSINSKVIIMDEPTAALTDEEIECLFDIIENLKKENIAIIYISHRMNEIFRITNRVTVFRDGKFINSMLTKDTNHDEIVRLMVGSDLTNLYPKRDYVRSKEVVFEAKNIRYKNSIKDVSFKLYEGEILGIAGLLGSGNILLSKLLAGYYGDYDGEVFIKGKRVKIKNPAQALSKGIFVVSDDRKNEGLVLVRNVKENISLASLKSIMSNGLLSDKKDLEMSKKEISKLNIKVSSPHQIVGNLSGGNQQKVVFGKMLETNPEIIFLNEPTRGIDIGAKAEIYNIMHELTKQGISIVLITSDLPELIGMSDRGLVMREGEVVASISKEKLTQENVLSYAAGAGGVY
ncbi:ribose import ATP-binding protein RbsA [Vallitalea longa]|uniref:Ribose import ATP-binding protein RbsA n=1 Tax=Vallitalea longa TaxID=2936439 RepID=A0A9W5Y8Y8_9FIRM|nr:sugar ABC transporter ATP-binding protein [Vallitalea longa]GKX28251.1 ribose import ATP-binding protein RbsA [Vallitalea longa]